MAKTPSRSRGGVDICAQTWRADRSRTRATGLPVAPIRLRRRERTDGPWTPTDLREDPRTLNDVQEADESLASWTRHRIGVRQRHRRRITGAPARFACPFLEGRTGRNRITAAFTRTRRVNGQPSQRFSMSQSPSCWRASNRGRRRGLPPGQIAAQCCSRWSGWTRWTSKRSLSHWFWRLTADNRRTDSTPTEGLWKPPSTPMSRSGMALRHAALAVVPTVAMPPPPHNGHPEHPVATLADQFDLRPRHIRRAIDFAAPHREVIEGQISRPTFGLGQHPTAIQQQLGLLRPVRLQLRRMSDIRDSCE